MLRKNYMNHHPGLVNGLIGCVVGFTSDALTVNFDAIDVTREFNMEVFSGMFIKKYCCVKSNGIKPIHYNPYIIFYTLRVMCKGFLCIVIVEQN